MPVVLATWEAEAGELLEPGRQGCSEPRSCPCTPAWITEGDPVWGRGGAGEEDKKGTIKHRKYKV